MSLDRLKNIIDKQIEFNQDKNLFGKDPEAFQFIHETVEGIAAVNGITPGTERMIIEYTTDKAIEAFCRVNQYYSFHSTSKSDLKTIYTDLFNDIRTGDEVVGNISRRHYRKLKKWLAAQNPFAEKIYENEDQKVSPVPCSEYSAQLQLDILRIDLDDLVEPVLDIGCGSQGHLVKCLMELGLEVHGIDRYRFHSANLETADWLEYEYESQKWGTIISHLGFSNHFVHHHLRADGNYIQYGKTYMRILQALKIGGSFYYTPELKFIEPLLDRNQFTIQHFEISGYELRSTQIIRLT